MLQSSKEFEYVITILGTHCYTMKHHNGFTNISKDNISKRIVMNTFRMDR